MSSSSQVQRMLALVPYLQAHDGIPVDRVAAEFGVSPQVIRKDLKLLMFTGVGEYAGELIDFDLSALDEDGVVFIRDAEFMTRPLRVTTREATALIVALRTLRATADGRQVPVIDSALAKLEDAVGSSVAAPVDVHLDAVDHTLRDRLAGALADGHRVRLTYSTASRDERTERLVDPQRIISEQGRLYLEAWCHVAEDLRFFRFDRIDDAVVTDEPATVHAPTAARLSEGLFQVGPDTPHAILDLEPRGHWLAEHYDAEVLDDSTSVWRVRLHGGDEAWLRRLVLRNAGAVRVVEPTGVRTQVADSARRGLAAYDEDVPAP